MPSVSLVGIAYLVLQAFVAELVRREADSHGMRSPITLAVVAFVLSIGTTFALNSILAVLVLQATAIVVYLAAKPERRPRPN
ncbi:hypothetical protein EGH25_01995 [Haladaptatus sp. F3-133]|jgi:hypothetical protein|uniref:Sporulation control protein n=1 Tax=Halorutilus salinus TaxID=2487751 RepID=A0A9Q4C1B6_9EURY|nr:hypothetical protein [Halorutilus salinus]MCX2818127.1 hypothetical protein [Halorutilus salinus]